MSTLHGYGGGRERAPGREHEPLGLRVMLAERYGLDAVVERLTIPVRCGRLAGARAPGTGREHLGAVRDRAVDGHPPVGAVAAALVPLLAEQSGAPEHPVHAGGVLAGPEREQVAQRLVRPAVIVGVQRRVARPQFLEPIAVLGCARPLDQGLVVAGEACGNNGAVEVRRPLLGPQPKA